MLHTKIKVRTDERAIIIKDEKLDSVLETGHHNIWHFKKLTYQINNLSDLNINWSGIQAALRFQRPLAEKLFQVIESSEENITIVWHKYLPAQIIPAGEIRAFWRPEQGDIQQLSLPKNEFWLPENIQAALLTFSSTQLGAGLQKITVKPHEKLMVTVHDELTQILGAGEYVLHFPVGNSVKTTILDTSQNLEVQYSKIQDILRFQRDKAAQYWQVIDSPIGYDTIVWHDRHLAPKMVPSGESRAFWQPENGEIHTHQMAQQAFRLPENVEHALLQQTELSGKLRKITVKAHEKMLITVRGQLHSIDGEGEYVLRLPDDSVKLLFAETQEPVFQDFSSVQMWAKHNPDLIQQHFDLIEVSPNELVVYALGKQLAGCVLPNTQAYFWRNAAQNYQIQHIDLKQSLQIDATMVAKLQAIDLPKSAFAKIVHQLNVPPQHQGLVYIHNELQSLMPSGSYYYWNVNGEVQTEIVDLRTQTIEISGQELLSEDKVTLRVNALCHYRITDAPVWLAQHHAPHDYLYRELQFAIRAIIGSQTIDKLLENKQLIDQELAQVMRDKAIKGIEIEGAGVKDIILPGEIRTILSKVVEAEKSAQANNIRRREETAATRSLLNTARVMEENPTALRLKELETLEKVTEKIDKISVYGGLDGVLKGLINIGGQK